MAIFGIVLALVTSYFFGPVGVAIIMSVGFGMIMSMYMKQKKMYTDLQKLKIRLGIEDEQTIQQQLHEGKDTMGVDEQTIAQSRGNHDLELSIEKELEQYEKHHNDMFNSRNFRSDN